MKTTFLTTPDYAAFVADLKSRVASAHLGAARSVNRELILLYWDIGQAIVEKQKQLGWGESVVEQLATDLQNEFPRTAGFSSRNLWDMKRLYTAYHTPEFLRQAVAELNAMNMKHLIWRQPVAKLGDGKQHPKFLAQPVLELPVKNGSSPKYGNRA